MKKLIAPLLVALSMSGAVCAATIPLHMPPGQIGGNYSGFNFSGNITSYGDEPRIQFQMGSAIMSYNAGRFDFEGMTFDFDHYPGGNATPGDNLTPYELYLNFRDINGNVVANGTVLMTYGQPIHYQQTVYNIHDIVFSSWQAVDRQTGLISIDIVPVPEPLTYGMLLGGLALLAMTARRSAGTTSPNGVPS
ncbi:PEP-CTERM sorting domain-containing protein [Oxalobacteraceae bacterium]|nr:PEP-CTERM sorting domain-containing protein [Oxalobacteraceae bacterium]